MAEGPLSTRTRSLLEQGREPIPPFVRNVYIAHSLLTAPVVSGGSGSLCKILEEKFNIKCYPRHFEGDNSPLKPRIDQGVWKSEKCLILMTANYNSDEMSHYETQVIHNKARRLSGDTVIVVWLDKLVPTGEFNMYNNITPDDCVDLESLCKSDRYLRALAQAIIIAPDASLTCLPKENIGYGAATGFFYGYLRLVLPDFCERFRGAAQTDPTAEEGMLDRSVRKMLIILPLSCFCPTSINDKGLECVKGFYVKRFANRAGNEMRDYKSSVFKLTDQNTQEVYYFAGELATPLLTMYESYFNGLLGMTLNQLYIERDVFCFTIHQVLQHPENRECNDQYRVITWDDRKDHNDHCNETLYDRLLPILKEELRKEKDQLENPNSLPFVGENESDNCSNSSENMQALTIKAKTFDIVAPVVQNMAEAYDRLMFASYPIRDGPGIRGKALIINIAQFLVPKDSGLSSLLPRTGAEIDGDKMKELFEDLGFEVDMHDNVNRTQLESIMSIYNRRDHSNYDAFICCIMTHGILGEIYTSDCLPYRILDIVDMFSSDKCPSLRGKPKIFFVQSCQRGTEQESSDSSTGPLQGDDANSERLETDSQPDNREISDRLDGDADADNTGATKTGGITGGVTGNSAASGARSAGAIAVPMSPATGTSGSISEKNKNKACLVPGEPDILMSYSALPGSISYRDPHRGSLYIDALANNLRKDWDIQRGLMQVTKDVNTKIAEYAKQQHTTYTHQLPFFLTTGMSKLLCLRPIKRE